MKLEKLEPNNYYLIFNRGINGCPIFKSNGNKDYFLKLASKYFENNIQVIAFCLLDNHFHFLIEVKNESRQVTQALSNFFNAYSKAFNKQNNRTGSLFEKHFKRKKIDSEDYFKTVFRYVHLNPINDWETYRFSSFPYYLNNSSPDAFQLDKAYSIKLFEDLHNMKTAHYNFNTTDKDLQGLENLAGQDSDSDQNINNLEDANKHVSYNYNIKDKFYNYIQNLQDTITQKLEAVDGKAKFQEDLWKRPEGGGGRTRVIENGNVFEKGGVNISAVHGRLPETMQKHFGITDADFYACGLSLVLHPESPMVPTVHANWRYFEMYDSTRNIADQWFGGGQDLTPYYLYEEDAKHFHKVCKAGCDRHNKSFYSNYKKRCDEYFYNAHRHEARGVGGLFFDYCKATDDMSMQQWYDFVTEIGDSFLEAYIPIVEKRKALEYTQKQRDWQEIRRGRYVEFNLVHDKGTLFGLKTNGRIESILMSLPPHVQWIYDHTPEKGSEEERLIEVLKNPIEWA